MNPKYNMKIFLGLVDLNRPPYPKQYFALKAYFFSYSIGDKVWLLLEWLLALWELLTIIKYIGLTYPYGDQYTLTHSLFSNINRLSFELSSFKAKLACKALDETIFEAIIDTKKLGIEAERDKPSYLNPASTMSSIIVMIKTASLIYIKTFSSANNLANRVEGECKLRQPLFIAAFNLEFSRWKLCAHWCRNGCHWPIYVTLSSIK